MQLLMLYSTSIICGFCMMALEMIGGRFLQPVFGTGIDVWCAIISVFILSLSVGYVLGGRIADRFHTNRALAWVVLIAGCYYLLLPTFARPATFAFGSAMHGATVGSLVAAFALFFPPSLLLGCVSPMLVKLVFDVPERIGRITGTLYAIGAIGNVMGTLAAFYVLLWYFPLNANMIGMGVALCLTALMHFLVPMRSRSQLQDSLTSSAAGTASEADVAA